MKFYGRFHNNYTLETMQQKWHNDCRNTSQHFKKSNINLFIVRLQNKRNSLLSIVDSSVMLKLTLRAIRWILCCNEVFFF